MSMEMIAEMHISSPPAAFDYQPRKRRKRRLRRRIKSLICETFQTGTACMATPARLRHFCFELVSSLWRRVELFPCL